MTSKEYRAGVAQSFIDVLSEKGLSWKQGWKGFGIATPINGATGYRYKGINRFGLSMVCLLRGYEDPRFCTYNQIEKNGWKLVNAKKQGVKVEYWFPYDTQEKKGLSWKEYEDAEDDVKKRCDIRAVFKTVFNASLIEGIEPLPDPKENDITPDELIHVLSDNMQVPIYHDGGDMAFYRPLEDAIHLPEPGYFRNEYEYGSTALHELAHSTGAPHRLNRLMGMQGTESYAFEELVAEISSCFMSFNLVTEQSEEHLNNHKAYVQSWVSQIKKSPDVLIKAVAEAEKTASYMEYQAGLIPKEEYEQTVEQTKEVASGPSDLEPKTEVATNMGNIPTEDYLEIKAMQYGFDSYQDMRNQGYYLEGFSDSQASYKVPDTMPLGERYKKALALAGYEELSEPKDSMATVAFLNPETGHLLQTDGIELMGDELEKLEARDGMNQNLFEQFIHPVGRIQYYTKDLDNISANADSKLEVYPDFESAVNAYLSSETTEKKLGFLLNHTIVLAEFDPISQQQLRDVYGEKMANRAFDMLTTNELAEMQDNLFRLERVFKEDTLYQGLGQSTKEILSEVHRQIAHKKSEWGAWIGRSVNSVRPQDYVDFDIIGYEATHQVVAAVSLVHANEIQVKEEFSFDIRPTDFAGSLSDGVEMLEKEIKSFLKKHLSALDTQFDGEMETYMPFTERPLTKHYERLENFGYGKLPTEKKTFPISVPPVPNKPKMKM